MTVGLQHTNLGDSLMFLTTILALSCSTFTAATASVAWTYPTGAMPAAPTLYPDAQRPSGLLVCAENALSLLNAHGLEQWRTTFDQPLAATATAADLDADGTVEVLAALVDGQVICLNADGSLRWSTPLGARPESFCPVLAAEFHPAPGLELIAGFGDGWLHALAANGQPLWRFFGDKFRSGAPASGDVDADGFAEIVYGTDNGNVYCLDGFGDVKWRYSELAPYGRSGANLADLDGDSRVEVLITRSNTGNATCLMALDGPTGAFRWRTRDLMQSYCSNVTADLDGDGKLETLHADKGNWLYCTDAAGAERWRLELKGRGIFWAPAVADVDGDGAPDILVPMRDTDATAGACAFRVSANGTILEPLKLGSSANAGPAVADLDGDGVLEAFFATQNPNGIQAVRWGGGGKVLWPSLRGDSAMTARANAPAGRPAPAPTKTESPAARLELGDIFLGENILHVAWDAPAPPDAFATISVRAPGKDAEIRVLPLPEGATAADLPYEIIHPEPAGLSVRIAASGCPNLAAATIAVTPQPAAACNDEFLQAACDQAAFVGPVRPVRPVRPVGLLSRAMLLRSEQESLTTPPPDTAPRALAARATALRRHALELNRLAQALEPLWAANDQGTFVCWQDPNPWDPFDPKAMPESLDPAPRVTLPVFQNEHEDLALNLLNVSPDTINVRCVFAKPSLNARPEPEPALAQRVTLRRGVCVPGPRTGMILDALPELDLSRTITLAPFEVSQLWLVVDTYGLEPGPHELTLYLGSLEEHMTLREVPITIDVQPIELPFGVYAQMNWVGTDLDETTDQQLKDMLDHGISVAYGPKLPVISLDANGQPTQPIDWFHTDAGLARLPGYFQLLFPAPPTVQWPEEIAPKDDTDLYQQGFATAVRELAAHLREKGFGYERWAFYPFDEPWLTGFTIIPQLRRFCERVKAADPRARNYTDPTGLLRVEYVREFKDLIDVWQPEINILKRDPDLAQWFRENAPAFWAYEATDPGKELLPLGYYRAYSWTAWRLGLDGAGFWCYKYFDAYWPLETPDWSVVYQTNNQVVPSRRWEAMRDGQEDYRLLHALQTEIQRAQNEGRTEPARQAQTRMDQIVENLIAWQIQTIDEITRQTRNYELDYHQLMESRQQIANEILRLRAAP
jgi:hypothetical protein